MKATIQGIITAASCLLLTSTTRIFAIEGLQLSVQCSNVVLRWPSVEQETYVVQYRPTLDPGTPWQTLTSSLPADLGTNLTFFVHSNIVQHPNCGGGGSFSSFASSSAGRDKFDPLGYLFALGIPLAMPVSSPGDTVPVVLYPPGFEFSGFLIFDPATEEWIDGSGYVASQNIFSGNWPEPEDGGGDGDGGTNSAPETGFYRVVRNGAHLWGITNGMTFSGIVTIPVEAGHDSGTLVNLSLDESGSPVSDASISEAPFAFPLSLTMDTTRMSNGVHQIYASASWYIAGADHPYYQADSEPITVNVYNEISFPNWMPEFGQLYDSLYISAQSAHIDADWYIDVYGADSGYIGTMGGHTYDGHIEVVWNLIGPPPEYRSYTNEPYFDFAVETDFASASGSATALAPRALKNWDRWVVRGDWVVANQLYWQYWVGGENLNTMTDGFAQMAETFGLTVRPDRPGGEGFRIHYNDASEVGNWQAFRQALYHPYSRNLFYSGHGGNSGIGYDSANTNVYIKRAEIESMLHTVPAGQTNRHAFRFVFLDGCSTAKGHLCEAFGIIRKENLPHSHYDNAGLRRTAYVGWNVDPTAGYASHLVKPDHWKFIQNFQYEWTTGWGVREALNRANNNGPAGSNDIDPDDLTVFGCVDLGPNQHNGL